jgi:hypothetical protein
VKRTLYGLAFLLGVRLLVQLLDLADELIERRGPRLPEE